MEISLNRKKYISHGFFKTQFHEEYFNLKIYPMINELEKEAGLLSEFAEAYLEEGISTSYKIYGDESHESMQFLKDNLLNFSESEIIVIGYVQEFTKELNCDILLAKENEYYNKTYFKKIKIENMEKVLYLTAQSYKDFEKHFWYYYDLNGSFVYDNLICYTMIIKNGGPLLEQVLTENLNSFDRWCILDTGSTDGTQEIIRRVLKNKKGKLYEEPFVDFKVSRNRCLELAGRTCKFTLMLDDTYAMRGDIKSFLNEVRGDQFSDTFSLMIQSDDTEYYSNRIVKTATGLRYIHTIHEVITDKNNVNVTVPIDRAFIYDHRAQYMEDRTNNRKQFDLQLLFKEVEEDPNDPRALYYIAQTYGCIGDEINKAKYFELRINHPVQGYFQEKIDACFELARTYNFKVNCETKELITDKLSESQWKRCEELYLQAYELDKKRPDGLYFIGVHYYLNGDFQTAYTYFKKGFEVGYPIASQYSLKPTLSFHFLPKFLAEVSYFMEDYTTGLKAAELFLTSPKYNSPQGESWNLMMNWYNIHNNILKMGPISQTPNKENKILALVTDGGWEPWTGKDILTKGMGGSETWIIETARYLQQFRTFNVVVFCKTNKSEIFEGVGYNPIELFHNFVANNVIEHCIISRFSEYIPVAIRGHAQNISIIFHDTLPPEMIIPKHPKIKGVFGLTEWHATLIKNTFPQFSDIVHSTNYGIDQTKFQSSNVKTKNSFIYSSFPNRGLVVLLKMWPRIIQEFPDATLNIYCNLEQEWVNRVASDMMREIKALLKVNKRGITVHGWVSKAALAEAWGKTEYWLYPCIFEETFCLTAVEAAITKTCVISNNLAALQETVGDRGIVVEGNPYTEDWQLRCLEKLKYIIHSKNLKNTLVEKNYQWAAERSWKSQTEKFARMIGVNSFPKYWYKIKEINDYLLDYTTKFKSIVDIGCGPNPFENANITIDAFHEATHKINIEEEILPEEYDFVYTRHLLEDLNKPQLILEQIKLKAKEGYIETPSVYAECCLGVDHDTDLTKMGYHHHHSILWVEDDTLYILPKIEEFMKEIDQTPIREKLLDPFMWNTYYLFKEFKYVLLEAPKTKEEYLKILSNAFFMATINANFIKSMISNPSQQNEKHGNILNWTHDVPRGTKQTFEKVLKLVPPKSKILEIGTYTGLSILEILKQVPESTATVIDAWEDYHEHDNTVGVDTPVFKASDAEKLFYENTVSIKSRITVRKGKSSNKLLELLLKNETFNFIYVDASHRCLDVYLDAMIAWKLLKIGGIMAFDDYRFNKGDTLNSPYEAIEQFKRNYHEDFVIIAEDYRVYLKKIN